MKRCLFIVAMLLLGIFVSENVLCATYDATGDWKYSTSNNWVDPGNADCTPEPNETGKLTINQTGDSFTAFIRGEFYTGTISGATYTATTSYPEEGGTVKVTIEITLSSSTSGSGTVSWSWKGGGYHCKGGSDIDITKITIAGYVRKSSGTGISGVTMTFSGGAGTVTTDSAGYYRKAVSYGWSGTVTPSKSAYTFSPSSRSYSNVTSKKSNQNYTGTPITPRISGYVRSSGTGISGVIMTFSGGAGTVTTDSAGYYSKTVSYGWSGTVTPSKSGYKFSPSSKNYSNVTSDKSNQNYTGEEPFPWIIFYPAFNKK